MSTVGSLMTLAHMPFTSKDLKEIRSELICPLTSHASEYES
jgi:hypothetical protein